ncbi:DUF563 domain-containing protein [Aspergillus steynii IBT 23096]|uniref:EGF domain-specific O-linked N-acetylglucosamine transferase n=1 Tax=Aspergillus steynii IBT 23096 TaxID=1392250 RepID=A0A2I2GPE9_9EURO|nr:DUF563 domain-containing protein [Aspergillus steynii IBT 23096]PLB54755.1 DUF563 domain-containing protein [Aspergillus steynii IBT 23096]
MASYPFSHRRRTALIGGLSAVLLCALFIFYHPERIHIGNEVDDLSLPEAYLTPPSESQFCSDKFGTPYLENLRDGAVEYCNSTSPSSLVCFHTAITKDHRRIDSFCFGENAVFDPKSQRFNLECDLGELENPGTLDSIPEFGHFEPYWYETGPQTILDGWVQLKSSPGERLQLPLNYTILIKREGSRNIWHSLLEILSMTMTLDVLQMTWRPDHTRPFFTGLDADNTQVIILDDNDDGPYFKLWSIFANKPTLRLKDLPDNQTLQNIIIPLAGGSNPFWQGDWEVLPCKESSLLRTFTQRVLNTFELGDYKGLQKDDVIITFINRVESRRLVDHEDYLDQVRATFPHIKVQSVDFAAIPFHTQLKIIQSTTVLVGVHGAGLTHGMFLPPRSVMVEILPPSLNHKGFRNVASLFGHSYLSAHGSKPPSVKRGDWHGEDVYLTKEKFIDLMSAAVRIMYNSGPRDYDAV